MDEPEEEGVEGNPEVKQEFVDGPEVKQEIPDGVEVKQEFMDEPEVKQELIDGVEVKEECIDGVEVKEEFIDGLDVKEDFLDGLEAMEEVVGRLQMKKEMPGWLEEGIPVMSGVEVKEEVMVGEMGTEEVMVGEMGTEEVVGEMTVKEEEMSGGLKVEEELVDGMKIEEAIIDGRNVKEEMMGGMEVKEEKMESKMEVKEEAVEMEMKMEMDVKIEVKEEGEFEVKEENGMEVKEENGMKVKTEVDGMEVKNEGVKEEEMDGAWVREDGAQLRVEQEPPREPRVGSKRKLAMSSCETCGTEEAKYRCPRCMKCSCSLACVKKHKTELTCSGIREKTAFVSLKQFTEINLLSDYRFLEDVGRSADYIARDIFLKRPSTNRILNYMKNRARRHNIDLRILPIGFTKRRENSTVFDRKEQRFYWHLKLLFPQSHAEYVEKGVPGDKKLHEILTTYIDPEKSDPVIRQRLKAYVFSESGIQILMKIENMQHNLVRYYELDPCKSLIDNLRDKVVIEYPTLHVVLKGSKNDMIILGQERNESTESFGSENPALSSEEEGEIQESS
ncbi:box C/D snoRNA protein 1 isoform X2 [Phascolarctos cinereus]|uniref:Box C/D snoRNA protein 1 n=1 Tax=Phascolarctos cinereus TaxID=38626 RepID=A0A6P5KIW5_PHACI|nr:box C/D snoRNA protein 1 isoform X3 [Phascolarctos cinereus]